MILVVDANHACHLFWHMAKTKRRQETGDPEALPDLADVLDWFLIRLDNLRDYFSSSAEVLAEKGYEVGPLRCVAVFDSTKKCFRKDILPDYKAQRTRIAEVYEAVNDAKQATSTSDEWIALVAPDSYEADDLMASIAHQADEPVVIHSADKDMNQCLVEGKVGIVKRSEMQPSDPNDSGIPLGGEMVARHYRERDFIQEFGFPVDRWIDYQCLVGDSADNVKGCPFVGPVTAQKILQSYRNESLENIEYPKLITYGFLNKRQAAEWPAFIERAQTLRTVFTLNTHLEYRLEA